MDSNGRYIIKEHTSVHSVSEEVFMLSDSEEGSVYEINDTTKIIWFLLSEGLSPKEIVSELREIALNPDEIEVEDVMKIVEFFCSVGLLSPKDS